MVSFSTLCKSLALSWFVNPVSPRNFCEQGHKDTRLGKPGGSGADLEPPRAQGYQTGEARREWSKFGTTQDVKSIRLRKPKGTDLGTSRRKG